MPTDVASTFVWQEKQIVAPKQYGGIFEPFVEDLIQPVEESNMLATTQKGRFLTTWWVDGSTRAQRLRGCTYGKWVWCIYYRSIIYCAWSERLEEMEKVDTMMLLFNQDKVVLYAILIPHFDL